MPKVRVSPVNQDVRGMPEERAKARQYFKDNGIVISQWAIKRGFNPSMIHSVLQGNNKCDRGMAHQIAVDLGLKKGVVSKVGAE